MTNHEPVTREAVDHVLDQIREDINDLVYDGAEPLDSFGVLHDYVDANEYLLAAAEAFCPHEPTGSTEEWEVWNGWVSELAAEVDADLARHPFVVS